MVKPSRVCTVFFSSCVLGILKIVFFSSPARTFTRAVSDEDFFPRIFWVGGVKNFFGKKDVPEMFPRPKFPPEKKAQILPAEEIFEPKIS